MSHKKLCTDPALINHIEHNNTEFAGIWTKFNKLVDERRISSIEISPELTNEERDLAESCYEKSLIHFTQILNLKHKSNFSKDSWEYLIGPWMRVNTFSMLVKWKFLSKVKNCKYILLHSFDNHQSIIPSDINNFHEQLYDFSCSNDLLFIMSKLIKIDEQKINIKRSSDNKKTKKTTPFITEVKSLKLSFLRFIYSTLENIFYVFRFRKKIFLYKTMSPKSLPFLCLLKSGIFPDSSFNDFNINKNNNFWIDFRLSQFNKLKPDETINFKDCINALLLLTIPQAYLEEFDTLSRVSESVFPETKKYSACISSTAQWNNDVFKSWLMQSSEENFDFYVWQHGGTYGTTNIQTHQEYLERKISKNFFTWGWVRDDRKDKPFMRPIFLNKLQLRNFRTADKRILIVLTRIKNFSKGDNWDTDKWNHDYINLINTLCSNLSAIPNVKLVLRLNPGQIKDHFDYKGYIERKFPDIEFDKCKTLDESIKRSQLVISTQNSTVFLKTLLTSTISLGIWNEELIPFSDNAKPLFDQLKKDKVFFNNPYHLSKKVLKIFSSERSLLEYKHQKPQKYFFKNFLRFNSKNISACLKEI